jgi:hypothetical protein
LTYSIDGRPAVSKDVVLSDADANGTPNFVLLDTDNLVPNNHTILVTFAAGKTFSVDFLVYKPAFPDLRSKPDLRDWEGWL